MTLETIVKRTVETVEPLVAERQHELAVDCGDPALEIDVDATRLVQVLSNLVDNAAKYTDCGGHIEFVGQ